MADAPLRETAAYWLRIACPGRFTAGVRIRDGYVVATSPRFDGMFPGWTEEDLRRFAAGAGWTVEVVDAR